MVLMEKDGVKKYVPDAFIDEHRSLGYSVVGEKVEEEAPLENKASGESIEALEEKAEEQASEPETKPEKPTTRKSKK